MRGTYSTDRSFFARALGLVEAVWGAAAGKLGRVAGAAWFAWTQFSHVQTRVDIWLDPWSRSLDEGYQIVQALYGLSDGGLFGTGLGRGNPNQVPEAQNDFIFASIAEEMGLLGATTIVDRSELLDMQCPPMPAMNASRMFGLQLVDDQTPNCHALLLQCGHRA